MKIAVNRCYGGFGLSQKAYERLIELGVPVVKYEKPERLPDGRYDNKDYGEVIFDRDMEEHDAMSKVMYDIAGRYWESWISANRTHPLLIQTVEELGIAANGRFADIRIIDIPDGIEYEIDEYDGIETVREKHRSW